MDRASVGGPLHGHRGTVAALAFAPDGRSFYSTGNDGSLRRWPAPPAWADALCAKIGRNMSRQRWRERVSVEIAYICQCPGLPIAPDDPASAPPATETCPTSRQA